MPKLSPLAVVDPNARLAEDVQVGPFCVIGPDVAIGAGCKLLSHVVVSGHTIIGRDNIFHPFAVIGGAPQDLKYRGGKIRVLQRFTGFHEFVTELKRANPNIEVRGC